MSGYSFWSECDERILRDLWGKTTPAMIARRIGRSPEQVRQKAAKLGLYVRGKKTVVKG